MFGDCHRAALASVLELPLSEVPHFNEDGPPPSLFQHRVETWLEKRNLTCVMVPFRGELQHVVDALSTASPAAFWFLGGLTRSGVPHCVVGRRGRIVHDPGFEQGGIFKPFEDGSYWVTFLAARDPERYWPKIAPVPAVTRWWAKLRAFPWLEMVVSMGT